MDLLFTNAVDVNAREVLPCTTIRALSIWVVTEQGMEFANNDDNYICMH